MFFLIAVGFWLLLVLLICLFFSGASRLERQTGHHADEMLLTRRERRDEGIAQVHLFPARRSHS